MHIHLGFLTPLLWIAVAFVAIQLRSLPRQIVIGGELGAFGG